MSLEYILGIDVGGTNTRMGIVASDLSICRDLTISTAIFADQDNTVSNFLNLVDDFLCQGKESVSAMCFGFPSIISKDKLVILQTPNISGLDRIEMVKLAEERFNIPVFLEKDVNLLLRYDIEKLGLKELSPVLGFYIGTGFGNSIYIHKKFFCGANGAAGELGHIPLYMNNELCSCGNTGCVETIASGKYLVEQIKKKYPKTEIKDFFRYHKDETFANEFIELLSYPAAAEMNIFDPFAVVFGGGIVSMQGFPKEKLISEVKKRLRYPYPQQSASFYFSEDTNNAGVLGAAYSAFDRLA
ncbi:allose kinase [Treponema sp. OMZ 840]|uniref:allose kinase n=1 Tax=Treponema sp. OMZ 840 TaxID=244313 RepID=UPI003D93213B